MKFQHIIDPLEGDGLNVDALKLTTINQVESKELKQMMGGYVLGCLGGIYTRSFIQHLFYFLKAEILEAMPLILQFMVLMKENRVIH